MMPNQDFQSSKDQRLNVFIKPFSPYIMAATEQKEACFEMGPETHAIPMTLFSNNRYGTVPAFCRTTL